MSDNPLNWRAAQATAAKLLAGWQAEGEPGGAITLFDGKKTQAVACAGLADLAHQVPFTADSVVRYASITKHIFAALALNATDNAVDLETHLGNLLPALQWPLTDITVGQALDMTSGLPDVRETLGLLGISVNTVSEAQSVMAFIHGLTRLNYPAGSEITYTNTGYRLVEAALQAKGYRFNTLVQQQLARPLDVQLQAPESWFDVVPGLVPGYWRTEQGWQQTSAGLHLSASGSLTGSANALTRWLQCLLADAGPGKGVLAQLSAPRQLNQGQISRYGLGLAQTPLGRHILLGHGGSHAGYKSYFLLSADRQAGALLVSNREDCDSFAIILQVMAALLDETLPTRSSAIPEGIYATVAEPYWLEVKAGNVAYLGTDEPLYASADGYAVSLSGHMPLRLKWTGEAVEGEVGHVERRFLPVPPDTGCLKQIQGVWYHPQYRTAFEIRGNQIHIGVGPAVQTGLLSSLGNGRMLVESHDGPYRKRFCLYFRGYDVDLIANRSRILTFKRDMRARA
ncbi:CubicO group peptidase (beta-lactamase class C family) [Serratia fonticola]|uniref:CubicO group peptidase (Beta-lactamase class C family) n=1 Tax=Serratia fonticola TaxID=47917 RepID=A0A542D3N9_SERFO|nr:serine hydrolase domain-containing protein [Serratia fonticola]TQI80286.1 CubicO group peptidase (beta-lactamase class C family) [Serratia fonticola]TQI97687.1 CubicO group peptidase (beta-lactamase class C family) [Serratia fonticola]TVZ72185.1 CubicO group peptidase (beta-lactamase class C family) [Serratia fonticola]